jgi:hypothetical protein
MRHPDLYLRSKAVSECVPNAVALRCLVPSSTISICISAFDAPDPGRNIVPLNGCVTLAPAPFPVPVFLSPSAIQSAVLGSLILRALARGSRRGSVMFRQFESAGAGCRTYESRCPILHRVCDLPSPWCLKRPAAGMPACVQFCGACGMRCACVVCGPVVIGASARVCLYRVLQSAGV